jgi:hypothetical protein
MQRELTARSMGSLPLFVQNGAQQPAIHPLDDHVEAAALFAVVGLHHAGVVDSWPISCSRLKRSTRTGSASISGCGTLMATCRPSADRWP